MLLLRLISIMPVSSKGCFFKPAAPPTCFCKINDRLVVQRDKNVKPKIAYYAAAGWTEIQMVIMVQAARRVVRSRTTSFQITYSSRTPTQSSLIMHHVVLW